MKELAKTIRSYDQTAFTFAEKNYQISLNDQYEGFQKLLSKPDANAVRVLDLGCGPGRDTLYFGQQGYAVIGVDLSAGMLAEAVRRVPQGQFIQADMRWLPFASGAFGGVWACASLLHLPKSLAGVALAEMWRVLEPAGAVFLAVKRGTADIWRGSADEDDEPGFFFAHYLPSEIRDLVEDAGFVIKGISENTSTTNIEPDGSPVRWINLYARKV